MQARWKLLRRWFEAAARAWLRRALWQRALLPVSVMALLWWSSSRELGGPTPGALRMFAHNGMHVVAYAALGGSLLLALGIGAALDRGRWRTPIWGFLIAVAYGVVDELHQSFVPGRTCSAVDVASDACGALLAIGSLCSLFLDPRCARILPIGAVAALCSVALATWGPW